MNVDRWVARMTPDLRMRKILKKAAQVDDSPEARCVMKAYLDSQIGALIKTKAPNLKGAARAFVNTSEPQNIYRGLQLYVWLNEQIPVEYERETLILLGMQQYLEQEKKAEVARDMVDFLAVV
jgi:hypothetical protein